MYLDEPLHTLDIIIDEDNDRAVLRANKTELLCRGTKEYILSQRSEILTNRGYVVPEDWDYNWNVHLGPIWSPAASEDITQSNIVAWVLPEYFVADSSDATKITKAADRAGSNDFLADVTSSKWPSFSTVKLNNHYGIEFDGTDDYLQCQNQTMWGLGTGDFLFACVVTSQTDQNARMWIASYGEDDNTSSDDEPHWGLAFNTQASNTAVQHFVDETKHAIGSIWDTDPHILLSSRTSLTGDIRHRGASIGTKTMSGSIINPSGSNRGMQLASIDQNTGGEYKFLDGVIYEAIWIDTTVSTAVQQKIEGYLAHKYALTADLPSDHPYKTNPPRQSVAS